MRASLGWDVLFVLEEPTLRRAADRAHYHMAQQLRRTLVTLDRDYLDDRAFPPEAGSGVLVLTAPDERELCGLLTRIDHTLFRAGGEDLREALPLNGRKLHAHTDWERP
jgi:hypothetical protein